MMAMKVRERPSMPSRLDVVSRSMVEKVELPQLSSMTPRKSLRRQSTYMAPIAEENRSVLGLPQVTPPNGTRIGLTRVTRSSEAGINTGLPKSWLAEHGIVNPFQYTADEVIEIVNEKLNKGFPGIRRMFEEGSELGPVITRDRMYSLMVSLVGYISKELFGRVLKKLGLQHAQVITLEMFTACFSGNEIIQKNWFAPIELARVTKEARRYPEASMRQTSAVHANDDLSTATYFLAYLKNLTDQGRFHPEEFLPRDFLSGARALLKAELRQFFVRLCSRPILENELDKLWMRFDSSAVGHITINQFNALIGYSNKSRPSHLTPVNKAELVDFSEMISRPGKSKEDNTKLPASRSTPKPLQFESVIEEIIYHLEMASETLLAVLKHYDTLSDGFITKAQLREGLAAFGYRIGALDFEKLISKNHIRALNDLIDYKEFVNRFTTKEDQGAVNRIVNDSSHIFNSEKFMGEARNGGGKSEPIECGVEEMEACLIDFLLGRYIALITQLRAADKEKTFHLSQIQVKTIIEQYVSKNLNKMEWSKVLRLLGVEGKQPIMYEGLVDLINKRKPCWNVRRQLGHQVKVVANPPNTEQLAEVAAKFDQERKMHSHIHPESRSLDKISELIKELMKTRFMNLDFTYRQEDRKMTGRLDKEMLRKILHAGGVTLTFPEVEKLWGTFALAKDGLYTWSKFCQRYTSDSKQLFQAGRSEEPTRAANTPANPSNSISRLSLSGFQPASRKPTPQGPISDPILTKIHYSVVKLQEKFTSDFQELDSGARGSVTASQAMHVFRANKIEMTENEAKHVCNLFDLDRSDRFHYRTFLACMSPQRQSPVIRPLTRSRSLSPLKPTTRAKRHRLVLKLSPNIGELRRLFKKTDPLGQGRLSTRDFWDVLRIVGIKASDEEKLEVASLFDHKMKGEINYHEFTQAVLSNSTIQRAF